MSDTKNKWQLKSVYDAFLSMPAFTREAMIGFLLAAIDDEVLQLPDEWMDKSDEQIRWWCVDAITEAAIATKQGRVLKSELRGPTTAGIA